MHRFDMAAIVKISGSIEKEWRGDDKEEASQMERLAIRYAVEKMYLKLTSDNSDDATASPKLPSVGDVMKFNPSLNYDDVQETLHAIYHLGNFSYPQTLYAISRLKTKQKEHKMNNESLQKIKLIQEYVDKLNKVVRNSPYSFTWSPPTNHTSNQELDYFCIHCHCSLVQETKEGIEGCHPITLLYYFGQVKMLDERVKIESVAELNDWFHITLGNILSKYLLALTRLSNGDKGNVNFQKINQTSDNSECTVTHSTNASPKLTS